ncbi:hypothetical protein ZWY2020_028776 [Hordeum vulgare]|nr:hypothetical protein ZWY2020_028776 [Hordeum vulgare]
MGRSLFGRDNTQALLQSLPILQVPAGTTSTTSFQSRCFLVPSPALQNPQLQLFDRCHAQHASKMRHFVSGEKHQAIVKAKNAAKRLRTERELSQKELETLRGAYFFSTLCQDDIYRHVDNNNMVYRKDRLLREESSYVVKSPKEKKKGLFGMIMKDTKGSKANE